VIGAVVAVGQIVSGPARERRAVALRTVEPPPVPAPVVEPVVADPVGAAPAEVAGQRNTGGGGRHPSP
jgi:hypothetical protein